MKLASQIVPPPIGPNDISNRDYANAAGGGAWSFIRKIEVTGSAVQNIDITGLDGDQDGRYLLLFDIKYSGTGTSWYSCYPNASAISSGMTERLYSANATNASAEYTNEWRFALLESTRLIGSMEIGASSGARRVWQSFTAYPSGNETDGVLGWWSGFWNDTSANITSLRLRSDLSDGFAVGTTVHIYKIHEGPMGVVAQGAFVEAKLSADQASISAADVTIDFDTVVRSRGDLTVDAAGKFSTLKAGRMYWLYAALQGDFTTASRLPFSWRDVTNSVDLGNTGTIVAPGYGASVGYLGPATAVVVPTEDIEVELITAAGPTTGSVTVAANNGWSEHNSTAIIMEIGASAGEAVFPHKRPEISHGYDDEFESTTLNPAWGLTEAFSATAIDPYATFTTGGPRSALHTEMRESWLMVQPENGANSLYLSKAITVPTNFFVWARLAYCTPIAIGDNTALIALGLSATDTGDVDTSDVVQIYFDTDSTGTYNGVKFATIEGGSSTPIGQTTDVDAQGQALTLLAIQKIGSAVHGWAGTDQGSWVYLGTDTYTGAALDRVYLAFISSMTTPGNSIQGVDFIRFAESATFLP